MSRKRWYSILLVSLVLSLITVSIFFLMKKSYLVWYMPGGLVLLAGVCIVKQEYKHRDNLLKGLALVGGVFIGVLPEILLGPYSKDLITILWSGDGFFPLIALIFGALVVLVAVPFLMIGFVSLIFTATTEAALQKILEQLRPFHIWRSER